MSDGRGMCRETRVTVGGDAVATPVRFGVKAGKVKAGGKVKAAKVRAGIKAGDDFNFGANTGRKKRKGGGS